MKLQRKCKILHFERKKSRSSKTSGRPDWIEKGRIWFDFWFGQKIFPAFHRQVDLACPSHTSLVYTTLLQFYNTFKHRIQNTWLGFCLLKFPQITTASALDSNAKRSVSKYCSFKDIHVCLRFTPHFDSGENLPLSCFLSSDIVEEISASIKKKQAQQLRSYSTCHIMLN